MKVVATTLVSSKAVTLCFLQASSKKIMETIPEEVPPITIVLSIKTFSRISLKAWVTTLRHMLLVVERYV